MMIRRLRSTLRLAAYQVSEVPFLRWTQSKGTHTKATAMYKIPKLKQLWMESEIVSKELEFSPLRVQNWTMCRSTSWTPDSSMRAVRVRSWIEILSTKRMGSGRVPSMTCSAAWKGESQMHSVSSYRSHKATRLCRLIINCRPLFRGIKVTCPAHPDLA